MDKCLPAEPPHICPKCDEVMDYLGTQTGDNGWSVSSWRCNRDGANLSVETNLYFDKDVAALGKGTE
jgi:hypothetical protein